MPQAHFSKKEFASSLAPVGIGFSSASSLEEAASLWLMPPLRLFF